MNSVLAVPRTDPVPAMGQSQSSSLGITASIAPITLYWGYCRTAHFEQPQTHHPLIKKRNLKDFFYQ